MTIPAIALNDGTAIPSVGLGTYKLNGHAADQDPARYEEF